MTKPLRSSRSVKRPTMKQSQSPVTSYTAATWGSWAILFWVSMSLPLEMRTAMMAVRPKPKYSGSTTGT